MSSVESRKLVQEIENPEELDGVVKWLDVVTKGYGFITREGLPDVMVHVRKVYDYGLETLLEGSRIRFTTYDTGRGLRVFRIISVDSSTAYETPKPFKSARAKPMLKNISGWTRAKVKWFNWERGFGFVQAEGHPDIFVHKEIVAKSLLPCPKPDQTILVKFGQTDEGRNMASEVSAA